MAAPFKQVFGVTWKVLLSLMIISAVVAIAYLLVNQSGQREEKQKFYSQYDTSDYHTKMPKSVWDKKVAYAIKHQCTFAGMSKEEIVRALGQPTGGGNIPDYDDNGYGAGTMTYSWPTKDCIRYSGDSCAEYKKQTKIIFLQNGHENLAFSTDYTCSTLDGQKFNLPSR